MSLKGNGERVLVDVWDAPTRVLHWLNALLIITLMILMLGNEGMEAIGIKKPMREPVKELHAVIGHLFVVTFVLRIIWGFLGNRFARWGDIIPFRPERWKAAAADLRWYFKGFKGSPSRSKGHDPLASFFYTALFIVLVIQAATGLLMAGAEFDLLPGKLFTGGLSKDQAHDLTEALEEVHELGMLFMFFFIAAHIIGLVAHEVAEKKGLFSSMIHGRKYLPPGEAEKD
jgi:Ni,Fe-hydrogenase I cytochrome b subunit